MEVERKQIEQKVGEQITEWAETVIQRMDNVYRQIGDRMFDIYLSLGSLKKDVDFSKVDPDFALTYFSHYVGPVIQKYVNTRLANYPDEQRSYEVGWGNFEIHVKYSKKIF